MKKIISLTLSTLITLGCLTACTSPGPTTTPPQTIEGLAIPEIRWTNGEPHHDNPYAQALIDATIANAAAYNAGDYSAPYLQSFYDQQTLEVMWNYSVGSAENSYSEWTVPYGFYPGPLPMRITKVREKDGDSAIVSTCEIFGQNWSVKMDRPFDADYAENESAFFKSNYEVRRGDHGNYTIHITPTSDRCTPSNISFGYFNPAPDYDREIKKSEIIGPHQ